MVVGDLGNVEMADPRVRLQKKLRPGDRDINVCSPQYRAPDVFFGNQRFQEDMDMWSFGRYKQSGKDWLTSAAATAKARPPPCLQGCPEGLAQLVKQCLVWHLSARMASPRPKTTASCSRLARPRWMSAWPRSPARTASER